MKIAVGLVCRGVDDYFAEWYRHIEGWADFLSIIQDGKPSPVVDDIVHNGSVPCRHRCQPNWWISRHGFAAAKNDVLANCLHEADWCFMLDADEMLHPRDASTIHNTLERLPSKVGIVTITRFNQQDMPATPDGCPVPVNDWTAQLRYSKFAPEPQHKILRLTSNMLPRFSGIIHEEPVGAKRTELPLRVFHLNRMFGPQSEYEKMRLYCYLMKRCVDEPESRAGVNPHWYDAYYRENKEYVDSMAKEFEESDARFSRSDDS